MKASEADKAYMRVYRAAHREELLAASRAWHAAHREAANARRRSRRAAHLAEERATERAYRDSHREARNAQSRAWLVVNRELVNDRRRLARAADPGVRARQRARDRERYARSRRGEWQRAYMRQYRGDHPDAYREWCATCPELMHAKGARRRGAIQGAPGVVTGQALKARWDFYGGRCWMCGEVAATIDHVKPLARGGSNWPANLRPACNRCNARKRDIWPLVVAA